MFDYDRPAIDYRYFTDPAGADEAVLVAAVRAAGGSASPSRWLPGCAARCSPARRRYRTPTSRR